MKIITCSKSKWKYGAHNLCTSAFYVDTAQMRRILVAIAGQKISLMKTIKANHDIHQPDRAIRTIAFSCETLRPLRLTCGFTYLFKIKHPSAILDSSSPYLTRTVKSISYNCYFGMRHLQSKIQLAFTQ